MWLALQYLQGRVYAQFLHRQNEWLNAWQVGDTYFIPPVKGGSCLVVDVEVEGFCPLENTEVRGCYSLVGVEVEVCCLLADIGPAW